MLGQDVINCTCELITDKPDVLVCTVHGST